MFSYIEPVKKIIFNNRRITIKEVADDVGISFGSCQAIFTDVLSMKHAAAEIVPIFLNFKQKQRRMNFAQEILTTLNNDPDLLEKVKAGGESWLYDCDIETKAQWKRPEESRPKKARQVRPNVKYFAH